MHGAAQLHAALVAALTGLTTTGANVFDDESTAIPPGKLPALRILDDGEETIDNTTQRPPRTQLRRIGYTARVLVKAANAKAVLNAALAEIENALYTHRTLGGLARDMRVESIDKSYADDTEQRVGGAEIRIAVDWVCQEGSPQTCL